MPENYFDERIAKSYEAKWPELFESAAIDPVVDFLGDLAGTGAALELGIGTGRIAIPLSRRGVPVHGIDLSPEMASELRAKPGADEIGVTVGDFANTTVDGTFTLAYLLRNTIMNLTTQEERTQIASSHHYWVVDGQLVTFSAPFRYVRPAELDLMAQLAGLTLRERWSDWQREPFTSDSRLHVSVWEKPGLYD